MLYSFDFDDQLDEGRARRGFGRAESSWAKEDGQEERSANHARIPQQGPYRHLRARRLDVHRGPRRWERNPCGE
jgi:hypothetical protein